MKLRHYTLLFAMMALCVSCEKDNPQPRKEPQDNYDRFEMPKVDVN